MREHYGPVHYNPGEYPIPQDERGIHKCDTGMYPCDQFDADFHMPVENRCQVAGPLAMSHRPDPALRYQIPVDASSKTEIAGTGCMNLNCTCPNCQGDCKCGTNQIKTGGNVMLLILAALLAYMVYRYLTK
jgi:hypothetical protein